MYYICILISSVWTACCQYPLSPRGFDKSYLMRQLGKSMELIMEDPMACVMEILRLAHRVPAIRQECFQGVREVLRGFVEDLRKQSMVALRVKEVVEEEKLLGGSSWRCVRPHADKS